MNARIKKKLLSPFFLTLYAILFLIGLCFIFYFPLLFEGKMYTTQDWGRGDLTHFNYPLHHYYGDALKRGEIPFLNNEIYSGFPLIAEGQVGAFYLPNLLLFLLLPNLLAYSSAFLVVSILSSIGTFLLARTFGLSRVIAVFVSVTFSFSLFFSCHFVHFNMVEAFSLVPWLFYLIELGVRKKFNHWIFLALTVLQVQLFFTGHPQIALYAVSSSFLYLLIRSQKKVRIKNGFLFFWAVFIGTVIASVQLLPTWQLSKISPSSELESATESMTLFPYSLRDLAYFFLPSPFGTPADGSYKILLKDGIYWENNTFSGFLAIILFFISLFTFKGNNNNRKIGIIFLIITLFSMGWIYIFYYLPPFSYFRLPQRALIISVLFFSLLAGIGLQKIFTSLKLSYKTTVIVGLTLILIQFSTLTLINNYYNNPINGNHWLKLPETAQYLKTQPEDRVYSIGGVKLWEEVYNQSSSGWIGDGGEKLIQTKQILDPNRNITYGDIPSVDGYAKLVPLRTLAYLSLVRSGVTDHKTHLSIATESAQLLGIQSVRHIISAAPIDSPFLEERYRQTDSLINKTFYIYENPYYQQKIKMIDRSELLPKTRAVITDDLLSKVSWDTTAFVEDLSQVGDFATNTRITNEMFGNHQIQFNLKSETQPAFIAIAQSFDPNWKAFIGTTQISIFPVNINQIGLIIPPGNHTIQLKYIPTDFIRGAYISLAGIILLIISFLIIKNFSLIKIKIGTLIKR